VLIALNSTLVLQHYRNTVSFRERGYARTHRHRHADMQTHRQTRSQTSGTQTNRQHGAF